MKRSHLRPLGEEAERCLLKQNNWLRLSAGDGIPSQLDAQRKQNKSTLYPPESRHFAESHSFTSAAQSPCLARSRFMKTDPTRGLLSVLMWLPGVFTPPEEALIILVCNTWFSGLGITQSQVKEETCNRPLHLKACELWRAWWCFQKYRR